MRKTEREREESGEVRPRVVTEEGMGGKELRGGRAQKQEESIGGRKGGKEDRRKGREAGRDRTRYEVSVVMRGARETAVLGERERGRE